MSTYLLEIVIITTLILANGVFAMSEIAVLSARKPRLQQRAQGGDRGAARALGLAEKPTRFLSTVQIGITLVGILAGALGGAGLSEPTAEFIGKIPILAPYAAEIAVVLLVAIITFLSLVFGELVPKRLALSNPEGIASAVAQPMHVLARLGGPLISILDRTTEAILRLAPFQAKEQLPVTEEELKVLLHQGMQVGVFEETETNMVEGVLRLGDRLVGAMMTPRTEIEWLDLDDPFETNYRKIVDSPHSHFPLAHGNLDNLVGMIRAKDVLADRSWAEKDLLKFANPCVYIPESMAALSTLEKLRAASGNLAIVIDEFGGVVGMITLFDAMEAVIGEIALEGGAPYPQAVSREDGSWLVDGLMPVDQLKELLGLDELAEEERVGYQTVAGFILSIFKEIPETGQYRKYGGYQFEVVDMDGLRVDKVLVRDDPD